MRMRTRMAGGLALALMGLVRGAEAGVLFFVNDEPGFAVATASLALLGSEDWSSAGDAPLQTVDDPLLPGVENDPFPNGVAIATGMTVQSNTLGESGTTPAPGGNLAFAPEGFVGNSGNEQPSGQLSSTRNGDGFDMIFGGAGVDRPLAVAFSPMFYRTNGPDDTATVAVRVFDAGGAQLGTTSVPNVEDVLETSFLGIVATEDDVIGRVNLWAGAIAVVGADNIDVFTAPETEGVLAALATLAALSVRPRGRARRSAPSV